MPKLVAAEVVTPRTLDANARARFEDALYDVQRAIFDGVSRDSFLQYVVYSNASHTAIQLYRGPLGELAGYLAVHVYEREIYGVMTAVMRCETGILREYRGANITTAFFLSQVVRYLVAHPRRPFYFLGSLVHPSSYSLFARCSDRIFPREGAQTPREILDLLDTLGDTFGLDRVDAANPLVRKVGWQTIDSAADRAYWMASDRAGVQFFLRENPDYAEGHGLLTIAPVTLGGVLGGLCRYGLTKAEGRARRVRASLVALWLPRQAA